MYLKSSVEVQSRTNYKNCVIVQSLNKENERPHKDLDSGVLVTACAMICAADCKLD